MRAGRLPRWSAIIFLGLWPNFRFIACSVWVPCLGLSPISSFLDLGDFGPNGVETQVTDVERRLTHIEARGERVQCAIDDAIFWLRLGRMALPFCLRGGALRDVGTLIWEIAGLRLIYFYILLLTGLTHA